jgi:hypothetical protein
MLVLYSTNTLLAYSVSEKYYKCIHYFWCSPYFDPHSAPLSVSLPPTSSPAEVYNSLYEEVTRGDMHSAKIAQNRSGIVAGATIHKSNNTITSDEFDEIVQIVQAAQVQDFKPLLFVAPYERLKGNIKKVAISARSHPLSSEYVADNVHRSDFDVIELPRRR